MKSAGLLKLFFSQSEYLPVKIYRMVLLSGLISLFIVFSVADDGVCTSTAAIAIGKDEAYGCVDYWLNRYQSLIGGFLALLGAFLAFYAVRSQIDQAERLNGIAKSRKEDATTAVAPFALSMMVSYASECMNAIAAARIEVLAHSAHPILNFRSLPSEIIPILRDYVEFGDEVHSKKAAMLLYATQIQQSRIHSLQEKVAPASAGLYGDDELQDAMFDALDLHAQVSVLFDPIRRDYRSRTFFIDNMYNDLKVRDIELDDWPRLKSKIEAFARSQVESER